MLRNKCFVISITINNKVIYLQQISVFREKKKAKMIAIKEMWYSIIILLGEFNRID